jgi:hypothetical protein
MANVETRGPSTPMILGIVGGVLLGIGSFLNWATVSVNFDAITAAIGVVPPAEVRAQGTASVTGWDVGQGKWTFVTGVVVVIASALLVFPSSAQAVAFVVIFGGAVGGSMALYEATVGKDQRLDDLAGIFALTLPGSLRQYFSVSIGVGLWLCIAGGVVAVVAGIIAMVRRPPSVSATTGTGEDPFGTS